MKLIRRYDYNDDLPISDLKALQDMVRSELMKQAGDHMEYDKPYSLMIKDEEFRFFDDDGSIKRRKMGVVLEPIHQFSVKFLTPEETYLSSKSGKSLLQKLKNCLSYLLDNSGDGKTVCERIK